MNKFTLVAFVATIATAPIATAQDSLITVDLSGINTELAADLNVDLDEVPETVELTADLAAQVCGIEVSLLSETCVAIVSTADLLLAVQEDQGTVGGSSGNSAREFAPGQQDGPAKDYAPGQQEGATKDSAPGQMKKETEGGHEAISK